ncbi:MAG: LTA synthase family protein [Burkholderiaceae bacterium]
MKLNFPACRWPARVLARLFPGRFALAGWVLLMFLVASLLTRLGLVAFNGDWSVLAPQTLIPALAIGTVYDLAAGAWWMLPFALIAWLWPDGPRSRLVLAVLIFVLAGAAAFGFAFTSGSEFVFWNEFAARFNFIAVDYLIYTREVIGNIRESYSIAPMLAGVGLAAALLLGLVGRGLWRATAPAQMALGRRSAVFAGFVLFAVLGFVGVKGSLKEGFTANVEAQQLAGNGPWEFFHAFRSNQIDYDRFYRTIGLPAAYAELRSEFEHNGLKPQFTGSETLPIERRIVGRGAEKKMNVVLISVESLSADYLGVFGNTRGLTPRLDALAAEGLLFTRLYATGTRTVRGLEALALSLPPTPGHSVVKRPNNENLYTLGEVFAGKGYEPLYLYGGYGYFDNMQSFFGGNGYTVIDRTAIPAADIHYENIWGVADEDLFTLALRELDQRHAAAKPFFAHVMTTSNHRPYTYPAGRIDIAPATGADGAVKYTDWAIGDFIDRARSKPWFANTLFVIVADHCAAARGKTDLPLDRFHIPMIVYAPGQVAPGKVETIASQIDVAPTVLALLNFNYTSRFFGQDILNEGRYHQRALLANYQTVGYYEAGKVVELRPQRRVRVIDAASGAELPLEGEAAHLAHEAIGYYEAASSAFKSGALRRP